MTSRKALIVGATGLVGGYCLQALCDNPQYSEVTAIVRKSILKTHRKLKVITSDFSDLKNDLSEIQADDVYCCLGTTIKKAGSQEAFKKIDQTLVVTVAELMKKYAPVEAESVAHFMVKIASEKTRSAIHIYESNMIRQIL